MMKPKKFNSTAPTPLVLLVDDKKMELELNGITLEEVDPSIEKQFFEGTIAF